MDKQKITIIVLSAFLLLSVEFIIFQYWLESHNAKLDEMYQLGYDTGLREVIITLFSQTENCQPATLFFENATKQVFNIRCVELIEISP